MNKLLSGATVMVVVILAACGGNVVVDSTVGTGGTVSTGGAVGMGGTVGTGASVATGAAVGDGGSSAGCLSPGDPGSLFSCGSGSTTGSSGGFGGSTSSCDLVFCDSSDNMWEAICEGDGCQCLENGTEVCTCALNSGDDVCALGTNCCFGSLVHPSPPPPGG
jgi:hypothetical protein